MGANTSISVGDLYGRPDRDGGFILARITVVGPDEVLYDIVDDHGARKYGGAHFGLSTFYLEGWRLILSGDVWHSYHGQAHKLSDSDHQPPDNGPAHRLSCYAANGARVPCICGADDVLQRAAE